MTVSPGLKSVTLYGPVPTGLRLLGELRAGSPLSFSKMWRGITRDCAGRNQTGFGWLKL